MKKIIGMAAILMFGLSVSAFAQEPGHYELFQGKYKHWNQTDGNFEDREGLFLLDTTTGDCQVFISTEKDGKRLRYWEPAVIDENKPTFGPAS